jgi:hypothetical protein
VGIDPARASRLDCSGIRRSLDASLPDEMRRSGRSWTAAVPAGLARR